MKKGKRVVLLAGTINHFQDTNEVSYVHLDASDRKIFDSELNMMLVPDVIADLSDELPMFEDDRFDEIRCHHVLEHMTFEQSTLAVNAMARVLKPGGVFDVETPDMDRIAQSWVDGSHPHAELQQWIYGEDLHGEYDGHRQAISGETLKKLVEDAGLVVTAQPETGLAVRFIAQKPLPEAEEEEE